VELMLQRFFFIFWTKLSMTTARTSSLDLGSFLVAKGIGLLRVEPSDNGRRAVLVFAIAPEQMQVLEQAFYQGGQVSAVALLAALRNLRKSMDMLLGKNNAAR